MRLTDELVRGFVGWQLQFFVPESGDRYQGELLVVEIIPGQHGEWPVLKGKLGWSMISKEGGPWYDQAVQLTENYEEGDLPPGEFKINLEYPEGEGIDVNLTANSCTVILCGHDYILVFFAPGHAMSLKPGGHILRHELEEYGKKELPLTAKERGL